MLQFVRTYWQTILPNDGAKIYSNQRLLLLLEFVRQGCWFFIIVGQEWATLVLSLMGGQEWAPPLSL